MVSVDETDLWAELAGKGTSPPSGSEESMLARVRAQGAGGLVPGFFPALGDWLRGHELSG